MEEPFSNDHLLERILSAENVRRAWKQVRANKVAPVNECGFLGFVFVRGKIRWSDKSFLEFKRRIRLFTGRSWFVSMEYRYGKLAEYVRGWMNYSGISEYYRPIPLIDEWLRRRIRMCYWKQWRYARDQSPQPPQTENFQETGHYDGDQPQRALASCQDPGYTKRYDQ
ncbi:MAG: group II intron maturase-specific domain-containing protein [Desulfobacula sp.]